MTGLEIRPASAADFPSKIWPILETTIRAGDVYALPRDMSRDGAQAYWCSPENHVFIASQSGAPVGSYYVRANARGGGAHVANAGYVTAPALRGRGIARAMGEHSLVQAKALGFRAMQFNYVVAANESAVHLWRLLGFAIVGTLPEAFTLPSGAFSDVYVMYRKL